MQRPRTLVTGLLGKMMRTVALLVAAAALVACGPKGESADALAGKDAKPPATQVRSGPFGIEMGMPINELKAEASTEVPGGYTLTSVPKPHPDIESVSVIAFPETGICKVRAVTRTFEDDGSGVLVRGMVDTLGEQLAVKYGKGDVKDICSAKYGCDSDFWTMRLKENTRLYGQLWTATANMPLPDNVETLVVAAEALDYSSTYAAIEYEFANNKKCREFAKTTAAGSL